MTRRAARALLLFALLPLASCARTDGAGSDSAVAASTTSDVRFAGRTYSGDVDRGSLVFATNCATCHGTGGISGGVGPSLIDENKRQDLARTIVWIEAPDPPMPKLYPSPLTARDVEDVATFVQSVR